MDDDAKEELFWSREAFEYVTCSGLCLQSCFASALASVHAPMLLCIQVVLVALDIVRGLSSWPKLGCPAPDSGFQNNGRCALRASIRKATMEIVISFAKAVPCLSYYL